MKFESLITPVNERVINIVSLGDSKLQNEFLIEYSEYLYKNRIRAFHSLERYLSFKPDGTLNDIQKMFGSIDSSTVYDNYFEGVLAFDITELLYSRNELTAQYFCEHISDPKYANHSTIILFVNDLSSEVTDRFEKRLNHYSKVKTIDRSNIM